MLFVTLSWFTLGSHGAVPRYEATTGRAEIMVRSMARRAGYDATRVREALEPHAKALGACMLHDQATGREAVVQLLAKKSGALAKLQMDRSAGRSVDACLTGHLSTVHVEDIQYPTRLLVTLTAPSAGTSGASAVPLDPAVRSGTLSNGMRYFVEPTVAGYQPLLTLYVPTGSLHETDEERGLAHFVEHMGFNSTERYPGASLRQALRERSLSIGAHANAYTTRDHTLYWLYVGHDQVPFGLEVLGEWSAGMAFEPAEVAAERAVVVEEWRRGRTARQQLQVAIDQLTYQDTRLAERSTIGVAEQIRSFTPAMARAFYERTYHPSEMAVIVTGGVDPDAVVPQLEQALGGLASGPGVPLPTLGRGKAEPRFAVTSVEVTDHAWVSIRWRRIGPVNGPTHDAYRAWLTQRWAREVLNEELQGLTRGGIVRTAQLQNRVQTRHHQTEDLTITAAPDAGLDAVSQVWATLVHVAAHGADPATLEATRASLVQRFRTLRKARPQQTPSAAMRELVRHVRLGEIVPGIIYEAAMAQDLLDRITAEEVNAVIAKWVSSPDRAVVLGTPADMPAPPSRAALRAALEVVSPANAAQYLPKPGNPDVDAVLDRFGQLPTTPGTIVDRSVDNTTGLHRLDLGNGVVVWWRPESEGDVHLYALAGRGHRSDDLERDALASAWATRSGVGGWSRRALEEVLEEGNVSMSASAVPGTLALVGRSDPAALETLLQLTQLRMLHPRFEPDTLTEALEARSGSPTETGWPATRVMTGLRGYTSGPSQPDPDALEAAYAAAWSDITSLHVVLVGRLPELHKLEPLVARTLATLPPVTGAAPLRGFPVPAGARVHRLSLQGVEAATVRLQYHGPLSEYAGLADLRLVAKLVRQRMVDTLRERLGGTYSPRVVALAHDVPGAGFEFMVQFECDPARAEALAKAARSVVADLHREDLGEELDRWRESGVGRYGAGRLGQAIARAALRGEDPGVWMVPRRRWDAITADDLHDTLRQLRDDRVDTFIFMPQAVPGQDR